MAKKKLVMRVGAIGLMSCAMALFAAQAGVLPGLDRGTTTAGSSGPAPQALSTVPAPPSAETPAALAAVLQAPAVEDAPPADAFASVQGHDLPDTSGFSAAPEIAVVTPALATGTDPARPAAFEVAATLPLPRPLAPIPQEEPTKDLSPFGLPCGFDVTAEAIDAAMVAIDVAAPCHPDAVVTITHSDMTIAEQTDPFGLMTLDLPALESPAFITVTLPDGSESDVLVDVPGLADYDRVALAWQGDLGVELHVMENGAAWMSAGHVRPNAPRTVSAVAAGEGYMTLLGDRSLPSPMLSQVYTMPRQDGPASAQISVDAPVTVGNCARLAEARVLHVEGVSRADMVPLSFTYPTCDAVGDTLVLQNIIGDLRLASN
jgi:hypothetical protein